MYAIYIGKKLGKDKLLTVLLADGINHAESVKTNPGVGKPFLIFDSLPDGMPSGVDFSDAPIVNIDASVNQAAITAMLANPPWNALTYS